MGNNMNIPENPYRKAMANLYMERHLGKPEEDAIKKMVNGDDGEKSLDYYIAAERFISRAMHFLMKCDSQESKDACKMFSMMTTYVSYEIERLSAMKNTN